MSGFLRWLGQAACFILLVVLLPLTVTGLWTRATLLDTDQYTRTIGPLAGKESVQTAITAQIMSALDALADPNSDDAGARRQLAEREYEKNRSAIESAVKIAVGSPEFDTIWAEANRNSHATIVKLLRGEKLPGVVEADGLVTIDLGPAYASVQNKLAANGVEILTGISPNEDDLVFTIFKSEDLEQYRTYVRIFNRGTIAIALVTAVVALLFIWAAATPWRGIFWLSVVIAVTMGLVYFGLDFARDATVGTVRNDIVRAADEDIFNGMTATLKSRTGVFALGASILAVAMFVVSRFRSPDRSYR